MPHLDQPQTIDWDEDAPQFTYPTLPMGKLSLPSMSIPIFAISTGRGLANITPSGSRCA
ncbi:MAG: hypothetical protein R2867_14150 [Caldilineaceae bacterium]